MQEQPFGGWPSPLGAASATGAQNRLGQIVLDGERVLWLEGRPAEGGRVSLMALDRPGGGRQATELTPAPLNVRTRLHEYGGSCVAARDGLVVLVNDRDQRLYRRDADGSIRPISPDTGGSLRFAEPLIDWQRQRVVAVAEDHRTGGEPANLPDGPAVFLCASGARTTRNSAALASLTENDAYCMTGGIMAWKRAGYPTQRG